MKHLVSALLITFAPFGCDFLEDEEEFEMVPALIATTNVQEVDDDWVYEAWFLPQEGAPVSLERWGGNRDELAVELPVRVDEDGNREDLVGSFQISIEPEDEHGDEPSTTPLLAGGFDGRDAWASMGNEDAVGTELVLEGAAFLLETPTTAGVGDDYAQGVWFVGHDGEGLALPSLPEGWVYEGWVRFEDGTEQSTGRWATPGADDDGAGPGAGPDAPFDTPGQDFIDPPRSLVGTTIAITIEPDPDTSADPFYIEPYVLIGIEDIVPPDFSGLFHHGSSSLPSATLTLE